MIIKERLNSLLGRAEFLVPLKSTEVAEFCQEKAELLLYSVNLWISSCCDWQKRQKYACQWLYFIRIP